MSEGQNPETREYSKRQKTSKRLPKLVTHPKKVEEKMKR
jgi:hypothetical protein